LLLLLLWIELIWSTTLLFPVGRVTREITIVIIVIFVTIVALYFVAGLGAFCIVVIVIYLCLDPVFIIIVIIRAKTREP
jgi:type IV secretory pathway VirB6-like protein